MTYRDLPYYEGISPKHAVNTKIMQTVYIPLENCPLVDPRSLYSVLLNVS